MHHLISLVSVYVSNDDIIMKDKVNYDVSIDYDINKYFCS